MRDQVAAQAIGNIEPVAAPYGHGMISYLKSKCDYVRNLSKNLNKLKSEEMLLCDIEADVKNQEMINPTMEMTRQCSRWLTEVQIMKGQIQDLRNRFDNTNRRLCGFYPFRSLLKLGKDIVAMTYEVIRLQEEEKKIAKMVPRPPVSVIKKHPMKIEDMPSLDEHVKRLIMYLKNDKLKTIGVFGLPGMGKTMVMEHLNDRVGELFEIVFYVTLPVPEMEIVERIQKKIVEQLNLQVEDHLSSPMKADIISEALANRKYLLLLDQVSSKINLKEVGIHVDNHNHGRVVFACSDRSFCEFTDEEIEIKGLSEIVPSQPTEDINFMLEASSKEKQMSISGSETENEGGFQTEEGTSKGATEEPFLSKSSKLVELPEPETTPISLEKQELLSAHGTDVMEKKGKMSIPETEIEIVPSQPTEEGTSKQAVVEPMSVTVLPSGKDEIEIAATHSQLLLEVSTYSNRSIEHTSLEILEYMNDVTARRIGFHGSDEIGRTSVLKALISNPKIKNLFDVVICVTVSRNWSTRKVQDEVSRQLPLSSEDFNTDFEIAEKLFQVLRSQRFLLILDDVWEPIDLNVVGIPDPASKKGCKMIFSTRFQNVCHVMGADREVQMEGLLLEEAWKLFREQVGGVIDSPHIQQFARAIVQKCHGFPLLIIVTGRALAKENDALAWMHTSKEFSQCSAHGLYGYEALIQKLKFSYDRLEGPDVKSCFLYCALFPEDQEISIDELVDYWIQEGLVAGNRPDSYKRGHDIVDILVGASLLQSVQVGLSIRMHNLIRDLASRILSLEAEGCQFLCGSYSKMTQLSHMGNRLPILEYHRFLSRAGAGLIELPLKEEWEEAKMIFFMDNELTSLPERPNCPRLLALFLQRNHNLRVIPPSFFDLMPSLTILNLSKTRIKFLPKSICKLTILEVLILRDCERLVQLPSEVGSLRRLVVLDLHGTKLNKLSNEISELASLRHLKVSFYGSVNRSEYENLPPELLSHVVIRNLSELETLSIDVYPGDMRWNENVKSVIDEVSNLTNLTTFCCYFPEVEFLERFLRKSATWKIGGLTEFKFVLGHDVKRFASQNVDNLELDYVQWGQCLRFVNAERIPKAVVEVLTRTTAFCLDHHINVLSLSEFGLGNFNGLRLCVVRECPDIQEIIAGAELSDAVFPILEHLTINSLPDLRKICKEMIPQGSFAKLRVLTVYTCPNLEFVFASSMVQCFSNLEELIVEDCSAIKKIVDSDSGTLPSLKRLKLHSLPNLVNIMKGAWPPLENISFYDCPMLKKLGIDSNLIQTIKEIKAEKDWWEELEWQDSSLYSRLQACFTVIMEEKGKMSIPETEIEIVPSQPTEEGTSKQAAAEPMSVTMLPSGKDEIEIAPTDSQLLLEVSTYSSRSIERTSLEILGYMNDVTARRIGFHGSDEIGRTSVLKALFSNPKIKDLFDVVIWVTVSRNWSTRKVQDKVLRQLPLSSEDFKTDFEIAKRLLQVLKSQQFLLILDDVWEPIDLNAVGIPDPASKKGCKMIFSTRFQNVCHVMGADREVQMEGLLPEEAWKLFQEQVDGIIDSPNIQEFARAIVQECHGFPLLIIVTGRALAKENDALAWMHASEEFSQCSADGIYCYEALIQKLKFSYDRLEGPDVKRCFLYCALFPEDQEISIDELVDYWIQEGLVAGNRPDSYKRGRYIVDILVGASLLQSVQAGLSIKMHYLIRDLASRILSLEIEGCQFLCGSYSKMTQLSHMGNRLPILEYHQFLSRAGAGLIELPLKEEWEEAKMIFFMDNELTSLPERPNCPILLALFLQRNHNLRVIPTSFFDLMPSLTILNLSKTRIKFLPNTICKLTILEVLILRDCERLVQLPSEVGSLRRLVVLDLQGTKLNKLSNEISELASLRHLKVSFYGSVNRSEYDNLPRELLSHVVIRNLSELETLSIDVYPGDMRWNENVKSVIDEVSKLTKLTTFCCYFPKVEFLELFLRTCATWEIGGLTEFKFVVGHDVKRFASQNVDNLELDYVQWGQCLRFVNGERIPKAVVKVLTRTTAFCLDHHINVLSLSEFGLGNFNGLRLCVVRECPDIQEIIAGAELSDAVFPILEHLTINSLPDLRKICKEIIPQGSFAKLRVLTVYTCPNLEFVFASSMVQCFSNLEELIVEDCSAIKKIVDSDSGTLPSLKRLRLHSLPNLVDIMKGAWPPLENISFYDCPMLKKLGIDSNLIQTIKEIKAEKDWWEELEWPDRSLYARLEACFTVISDEDL